MSVQTLEAPVVTLAPVIDLAPPVPQPGGPEWDRMSHLVLEGFGGADDKEHPNFTPAGTSVVEGIINAVPVVALCGKKWVPRGDTKKYGMCPTCKEIASSRGWAVPGV